MKKISSFAVTGIWNRAETSGGLTPAWARWLVGTLLLGYALALVGEAWRVGVTVDEPKEFTESYLHWLGIQGLNTGDGPPLMRMVCGWVPRLLRTPLPRGTPAWESRNSYAIGRRILTDAGPAGAHRLLFATRLPLLIFPLLTVWLVWHWGRQLFGHAIALALALALALEPTLMAHGALIKSDVSAACAALLFFYQAWRYWLRPGAARAVVLTLCLLVAVLAKLSLLPLVFVTVAIFLWKGPRLAGVVLVIGIVYVGLLAAYLFSTRPLQGPELQRIEEIRMGRLPKALARALASRLPLPTDLVYAIGRFWKLNNAGPRAYMLGRSIEAAAPWYFPLAWAIKFPVGLQLLAAAGLVAGLLRVLRRQAGPEEAFVCLPPLFFLALLVQSQLHLGFRYALPALPFLVLCGGFALQGLAPAWRRGFAAGCLLWAALACARIYPQGLAYFNEWIGGPSNGWRYLADSNLDWGQNLPELARWMASHPVPRIKLCYFGIDIPEHHLDPARIEIVEAPWAAVPDLKETRFRPEPGTYAISVNAILGFGFPPAYREYFSYFKARPPDDRAGHSIFIYHVQ